MPKRSASTKNRDPKTIAFWSFIAVALVVGMGLYWASSTRTAEADYDSYYTPVTNPPPPVLPQVGGFVRPPGDLNVLYIGDSLTVGTFSTKPELEFRPIVTKALEVGGRTYETIIGKSGQTTPEVFGQLSDAPGSYGLTIVETGTNDQTKSELNRFLVDYPALVKAARLKSPDGYLVCVGTWRAGDLATTFDNEIRQTCAENAGRFVMLSDLYANPDNKGPAGVTVADRSVSDDFPNDRGHGKIAERITGALGLI